MLKWIRLNSMKLRCLILIQVILTMLISNSMVWAEDNEVPENVVRIQNNSIVFEDSGKIHFNIEVHEGFFAYLDKFKLEVENLDIGDLGLDPIVTFYDKTFQKNKKGVKNLTAGEAAYKNTSEQKFVSDTKIKVTLNYQACTPEYCLFPTTYEFIHQVTADEAKILNQHSSNWLEGSIWYVVFLIFLAGLLTSLTPCVYPLIPITIAVLGREKMDSKLSGFIKSFIYVLGLALTYSFLGLFAASTGVMFGSILSNGYFIFIISLILFIAALSMFDVLEIKSPDFLNKWGNQKTNTKFGIFISGAISGLIVGPCVGPVLVGILSYVSSTGNMLKGFLFLFAFAMGMGTLIIVLGTFSGLIDKIPRSGQWMNTVKKILGFIFILMIGYFIGPILSIQHFTIAMSIVFIIFSILILIHIKKSHGSPIEKALFRSIFIFSILVFILSMSIDRERFERLVGYSSSTYANTHWDKYSDEKLLEAKTNGQIVILDFYADWCAACKELKHITFADDRVINFSDKIKWLYFDSTRNSDELTKLKKTYGIVGLPTVLFFDQNGNLMENLTLTGFENADKFLKRLEKTNIKQGGF